MDNHSATSPDTSSPTTTNEGRKAPDAPPDAMEAKAPCVEIMIQWGASVLATRHLTPPRSFYVGEAGAAPYDAADLVLPAEVLGFRRAPLVLVDASGAVRAVLPAGATGSIQIAGEPESRVEDALASGAGEACQALPEARSIALSLGSRVTIEVKGLVIRIALVNAGKAVAGRYHVPQKRRLGFHGASALLHIGAIATLALLAPRMAAVDEDEVSAAQIHAMQQYLASAEAKELEAKETEQVPESNADVKEGGTGTRAKGEEGSAGNPFAASGGRYGIQGPMDCADPHIARQAALRDAAEFGMVGLLNSGSGGDPNAPVAPWDADGQRSSAAPGQFEGIGEALGGNGTSPGGGAAKAEGIGLGAIGTIGHGAGASAGQGFGTGSGRASAGNAGLSGAHQAAQPTSVAAPPPIAMEPAPRPELPIDPNGRFATTYRPGGGHLTAFESAVSRGIVPAGERELVSDVGARYTPALDVLGGKALALRADLERAKIAPAGGPVHVRISLAGAAGRPDERPRLSVHLVLDVSGSMSGEPIARAREAAEKLVDKLAPTDDFSLVTFSTDAEVKVPDGLVGPRREAIRAVIRGLKEEGGTNIHDGLRLAYTQASQRSIPSDAVRVVLLLSDGQATSGVTSRERITRLSLDAFQAGIQTSAFGLGTDYDGVLMSSIASDGAGGYYYLRDGDQIASALTTELDKRLDPVATAVELRVRLKGDIDLLKVYGSRRLSSAESARVRVQEVAADAQAQKRDGIKQDRQEDTEGGMRFFIPAFARGDSHALLFKLSAPPGAGARSLASIELKYKDRFSKKNVVQEIPLSVGYADSDAASAATADASVSRTVQGFAAGEALTEASVRIARGDRDAAVALLAEREDILAQAATTLDEPLFLRDARRLSRLRSFAGARDGVGDPLVLSMLLETAGRVHMR